MVVLKDEAAKTFVEAASNNFKKESDFGESFYGIGGYYKSIVSQEYIGFNFTNGKKLMSASFNNKTSAFELAKLKLDYDKIHD